MFAHILAPLDFTPKSEAALIAARDLALREGAALTLLHVIETVEYLDDDELRDFYALLEQEAAGKMEEWTARHLVDTGLEVREVVTLGRRVREILVYAEEHGVDLIVLGSHPVDPDAPVRSIATISYKVAITTTMPVLLVK